MLRHLFAAGAIATLLVAPASVEACSFSWKPGWSPDEIRERSDLREVKGIYRVEEIAGERFTDEDGQQWIADGKFIGRIDTKRGTGWATFHPLPDMRLTCYIGSYFKPEGDAIGTFWISRRKVGGRYQIYLWDGEYLPAEPAEETAQ